MRKQARRHLLWTYRHDMQENAAHIMAMSFITVVVYMRMVMEVGAVRSSVMFLVMSIMQEVVAWCYWGTTI
jgi:hypothetical protein